MAEARPSTTGSAARRLIGLGAWLCLPASLIAQAPAAPDWRSDWALAEGFALRRDAEGFRFPTSIAFVPHPGPAPDDPLYFVAELQGTIQVVTNDRQVHTFARDVMPPPTRDTLPAYRGEVGLAGLCLEPRRGHVFATFAYADSTGVLRNGMARFETRPGRFALTPRSKVVFTSPFDADVAAVSHQIGPCQATAGGVYVSGDGESRSAAATCSPRWARFCGSRSTDVRRARSRTSGPAGWARPPTCGHRVCATRSGSKFSATAPSSQTTVAI